MFCIPLYSASKTLKDVLKSQKLKDNSNNNNNNNNNKDKNLLKIIFSGVFGIKY